MLQIYRQSQCFINNFVDDSRYPKIINLAKKESNFSIIYMSTISREYAFYCLKFRKMLRSVLNFYNTIASNNTLIKYKLGMVNQIFAFLSILITSAFLLDIKKTSPWSEHKSKMLFSWKCKMLSSENESLNLLKKCNLRQIVKVCPPHQIENFEEKSRFFYFRNLPNRANCVVHNGRLISLMLLQSLRFTVFQQIQIVNFI